MPGVYVGLYVVMVAGALVLHQTGRVEVLREVVHGAYPLLGFREIGSVGTESPGLVEVDPGEYRRVVVVAFNLGAEAVLPILPGLWNGLAPEVRRVSHDQEPQFVSPIELAWDFDLDVDTVSVEPEVLGDEDLVLHELVAGESIVSLRMVALVEAKLKI